MTSPTAASSQRESPADQVPQRRGHVRLLCDLLVRVRPRNLVMRGWSGRIANLSLSGLGVWLPFPIKPGMVLAIELDSPIAPHLFLARVVHVYARGQEWYHGCDLAKHMTQEELDLLACGA